MRWDDSSNSWRPLSAGKDIRLIAAKAEEKTLEPVIEASISENNGEQVMTVKLEEQGVLQSKHRRVTLRGVSGDRGEIQSIFVNAGEEKKYLVSKLKEIFKLSLFENKMDVVATIADQYGEILSASSPFKIVRKQAVEIQPDFVSCFLYEHPDGSISLVLRRSKEEREDGLDLSHNYHVRLDGDPSREGRLEFLLGKGTGDLELGRRSLRRKRLAPPPSVPGSKKIAKAVTKNYSILKEVSLKPPEKSLQVLYDLEKYGKSQKKRRSEIGGPRWELSGEDIIHTYATINGERPAIRKTHENQKHESGEFKIKEGGISVKWDIVISKSGDLPFASYRNPPLDFLLDGGQLNS